MQSAPRRPELTVRSRTRRPPLLPATRGCSSARSIRFAMAPRFLPAIANPWPPGTSTAERDESCGGRSVLRPPGHGADARAAPKPPKPPPRITTRCRRPGSAGAVRSAELGDLPPIKYKADFAMGLGCGRICKKANWRPLRQSIQCFGFFSSAGQATNSRSGATQRNHRPKLNSSPRFLRSASTRCMKASNLVRCSGVRIARILSRLCCRIASCWVSKGAYSARQRARVSSMILLSCCCWSDFRSSSRVICWITSSRDGLVSARASAWRFSHTCVPTPPIMIPSINTRTTVATASRPLRLLVVIACTRNHQ